MTPQDALAHALDRLEDHGTPGPCRTHRAALWTSEDRNHRSTAAVLCQTACPALFECAAYADEIRPTAAVYAGTDYHNQPATQRKRTA